jgi:hypothetical protein
MAATYPPGPLPITVTSNSPLDKVFLPLRIVLEPGTLTLSKTAGGDKTAETWDDAASPQSDKITGYS